MSDEAAESKWISLKKRGDKYIYDNGTSYPETLDRAKQILIDAYIKRGHDKFQDGDTVILVKREKEGNDRSSFARDMEAHVYKIKRPVQVDLIAEKV